MYVLLPSHMFICFGYINFYIHLGAHQNYMYLKKIKINSNLTWRKYYKIITDVENTNGRKQLVAHWQQQPLLLPAKQALVVGCLYYFAGVFKIRRWYSSVDGATWLDRVPLEHTNFIFVFFFWRKHIYSFGNSSFCSRFCHLTVYLPFEIRKRFKLHLRNQSIIEVWHISS